MSGWLCLLLLVVAPADASTLDLHEAILRVPFLNRTQDQRDLFGYSVALHDTLDLSMRSAGIPLMQRLSGARIVVGVPRGTPVGAAVDVPGYVADCPLLPGDCAPLRGNGMGDDVFLYDVTGNRNTTYGDEFRANSTATEEKSGMFLGGTMASVGDQFIVCGHRFVSDITAGTIHGICYQSRRNLSNFEIVRPCIDLFSEGGARSGSSMPLRQGRLTWCMGGIDATYLSNGGVLLGLPGIQRNALGGFTYGDGQQVRSAEVPESVSPEYTGYSVARGVIVMGQEHILLGSPRSMRGQGKVFIVPLRSDGEDVFVYEANEVVSVVNPGKIGSSFGHSVALVDFNGDGLDEVVVASPLHFLVRDQPEIGAVYVYPNVGGTLSNGTYSTLTGRIPYGRLGHAMAAIGDLDYDGYGDLVVSAPFAAFGSDEPGTVYVYRGSASGVVQEPAQVIRGDQLNLMASQLATMRSFGAALSGDTDIDGNTYNDLVIGAYEARQVVVLRSRTVVVIDTTITSSTTQVNIASDAQKPCELANIRYDCFDVTYCLSVRGKGLEDGQAIDVTYVFLSDPTHPQPRTIISEQMETERKGVLPLRVGENPESCETVKVYIRSLDSIYQEPLRPRIIANISDEPRPPPSDGNITPTDLQVSRLFSRQEPTDTFVEVQGAQTCDGLCETDVQSNNATLVLMDNEGVTYSDLFLGFVTRANLHLTLHVPPGVEDAYGVCVNVFSPMGFRYLENVGFDSCTFSTPTTRCCLNAPIASGESVTVRVEFVVQATNVPNTPIVTMQGQVIVGHNTMDTNQANNGFQFMWRVVPAADASISIDVTSTDLVVAGNYTRSSPDALPMNVRQLGRPFSATFTLINNGPSTIPSGQFLVYVPYRTPCQTNAFLYYISDITTSGVLSGCLIPEEFVDVLDIQNVTSNGTRLDEWPGDCVTNTVTIDVNCKANTTQCVQMVCTVSDFGPPMEGQIAFSGYLDEYYVFHRTLNHFALRFEADFVIDSSSNVEDPSPNPALTRVVLTNPNVFSTPEPFPWWAIAVPIVVAVVIVVALIIGLYLCGFFKRKQTWTPEEDGLTEAEHQENGGGEEQAEGDGEGEEQGEGDGEEQGEGDGEEQAEGDGEEQAEGKAEVAVAGAADTDNKELELV